MTTAEDTRTRIKRVALELVADRGYAGTSTRELSERMGFTKAALAYHFRTKDDLLVALLEPVTAAIAELVSTDLGDSSVARRAVLRRYADLVGQHADVLRVVYDDPSVRRHPAMDDVRPLYDRLFRLLAGTPGPSAVELARARAAVGAVHGALLRGTGQNSAEVRAAALVAACGALGVTPPRTA